MEINRKELYMSKYSQPTAKIFELSSADALMSSIEFKRVTAAGDNGTDVSVKW